RPHPALRSPRSARAHAPGRPMRCALRRPLDASHATRRQPTAVQSESHQRDSLRRSTVGLTREPVNTTRGRASPSTLDRGSLRYRSATAPSLCVRSATASMCPLRDGVYVSAPRRRLCVRSAEILRGYRVQELAEPLDLVLLLVWDDQTGFG